MSAETYNITMEVEAGSSTSAKVAEAWAVGKRGGVDVSETDPTYHNNAKYYAEQAAESETNAGESAGDAVAAKEAAEAAIVKYPRIEGGTWRVWDTVNGVWVDTEINAQGPQGETGATGNGIASISKTGTSENVDTYTITMTDGTSTTFTVTNADEEAIGNILSQMGLVYYNGMVYVNPDQ